jgi:hypothetical protein
MAMRVTLLCIPLAAVAVGAFARPSHADRREPMGQPGAACRPALGARAASFAIRGDIQNLGDALDAVVCPVLRDSAYAPARPLDVSVTVQSAGARRLTCTLHSLGSSGQLIAAFSRSTYGATPTELSFAVPRAFVGVAGSAYIQCALPPGAAVLGYYAGEATDVRGEEGEP